MRNIDIFISQHDPHTSRLVQGFDSVNSGSNSIGIVKGQYRQLNAIVTESATDDDQWRIVNLKGSINNIAAFDSIAVLGAVDNDHASTLAQLQFGRMFDAVEDDVIETNTSGLMRHLATQQFHKNNQLIQRTHLLALQDIPCSTIPGWDGIELLTHEGKTANLLLDMQLHDDQSGLLSSFDGLPFLLESIDAEYADFDSIIVEYQYLDKLMNMLHKAMQTASKGGVKVLKVDQSDKPFRHKKVLNVAVSYDFEDGQTITILFHHPDRDAKRIAPHDTLLSWKILMNNRDVTGVVQPNQGEGIALPVLAGRVAKLINQNSARFKRTQAKKAESAKALADAEQRIIEKQNQKSVLATEIQELLNQIDGFSAQNNTPNTDNSTSNDETETSNKKVVTKTEARQIYDALAIRHRWLTGGTTEEFYKQNYPSGIAEALTDAKNLLERPFGKVATANGLKESLQRMVVAVENTIERWNKGPSEDSTKNKTYPPIEDLGNGYYKAFKNDKKIDDWTAHINTYGEWQVSANNASSRAWSNGFGAPRFFKTIDDMIAKYPAFSALPALLPTEDNAHSNSHNDDADYLNKVIKGEVDFSKASEVEGKLESIGGRLTDETNDLFEQAVSAYSMYQVNQAATVS
ncbi:hypothetical protein F959_01683 [Acinetobacter venetianus RAG-1 = CIP 110063]|uniref:Defence against restriction A N-terminal domain-containing protein n=1 Tax=Acinetobacter venetianus (strain ATCC 31012 / DSM 23050 / BCRC 14357 / CCUG 45561 / CIP 110063 / KCTC 2702 / LMG 19082 / RAG-1) TaxID=1191460 RepID=N8YJJ6_ACIVR|nr:hypothetical protein [Acinetobacter venetianus]ENV36876.1 hypothetical protein F959_01683 [Acinetobacter venetianus RAG-1 = CIP 110063]